MTVFIDFEVDGYTFTVSSDTGKEDNDGCLWLKGLQCILPNEPDFFKLLSKASFEATWVDYKYKLIKYSKAIEKRKPVYFDWEGVYLDVQHAIDNGAWDPAEDLLKALNICKVRLEQEELDRNTLGYVYLMKADNGYYKIGKTAYPEKRIQALQGQSPSLVKYEIVFRMPLSRMGEFERSLHKHFDAKRLHGEWFALDEQDVEYIKSLATGK